MRDFSFKTIGTAVAILVSALLLVLAGNSLAGLTARSREAGLRVARDAVERAVMQCYALEGAYPPDLDYLAANYGLQIDKQKYVYMYDIVGSNIHPIIKVQLPGGGDE